MLLSCLISLLNEEFLWELLLSCLISLLNEEFLWECYFPVLYLYQYYQICICFLHMKTMSLTHYQLNAVILIEKRHPLTNPLQR